MERIYKYRKGDYYKIRYCIHDVEEGNRCEKCDREELDASVDERLKSLELEVKKLRVKVEKKG